MSSSILTQINLIFDKPASYTVQAVATISPEDYLLLSKLTVDYSHYDIHDTEQFCNIDQITSFKLSEPESNTSEYNQGLIKAILQKIHNSNFLIHFNLHNIPDPQIIDSEISEILNPKPDFYVRKSNDTDPSFILVKDPAPFLNLIDPKGLVCGITCIANPVNTFSSNQDISNVPTYHKISDNISEESKFVTLKSKHLDEYRFIVPSFFEIKECSNKDSCKACPIINHTRYHVIINPLKDYKGPMVDVEKLREILDSKQDEEYFDFTTYTFRGVKETYPTIWNIPREHILIASDDKIIERFATDVESSEGPMVGKRSTIDSGRCFEPVYVVEFMEKRLHLDEDNYRKVSSRTNFTLIRIFEASFGDRDKLDKIEDLNKYNGVEGYEIYDGARCKILGKKRVEDMLNNRMLEKMKDRLGKVEGRIDYEINIELGLRDLERYNMEYMEGMKE